MNKTKSNIVYLNIDDTLCLESNQAPKRDRRSDKVKPRKAAEAKPHQALCNQLIRTGLCNSWQLWFLDEISQQSSISAIQQAKLEQIAATVREREAKERRCRYCNGRARVISPSIYQCDRCGNCLNLQWGGEP